MATSSANDKKNQMLFEAVARLPIFDFGDVKVRIVLFHQTTDQNSFSTGWGSHPHIEFTLIRKGSMHYETENIRTLCKEGDMVFIPPSTNHRRSTHRIPAVLDGFFLDIRGSGESGKERVRALNESILKNKLSFRPSSELKQLFQAVDLEADTTPLFYRERIERLFSEIILLTLREFFSIVFKSTKSSTPAETHNSNDRHARLFEMGKRFIDDNYLKGIRIGDVASFLGVTDRYVNLIFSKNLGTPCGTYLLQRRLEYAYERLHLEKNIKVLEIARAAGFEDPLHFTKVFKSKYGFAPKQVRDQGRL